MTKFLKIFQRKYFSYKLILFQNKIYILSDYIVYEFKNVKKIVIFDF